MSGRLLIFFVCCSLSTTAVEQRYYNPQQSRQTEYRNHFNQTQRTNSEQRTHPHRVSSYPSCNGIPPDYWCDSIEISQRCGVVAQCDQFKHNTVPIRISLMFEALCPFCQRFISNRLGNLFNQFRGKVEMELVPWGNSRLLPNGDISCNHGPTECEANRLIGCVVDVVKVKQAIPFVICFERQLSTYPQVEQALHHCSTFIRNAYREIRECYDGERGRQLQRQAAYRTMNMRSHPIIEVPYFVISNYSPSLDSNALSVANIEQLIQKWTNLKQ